MTVDQSDQSSMSASNRFVKAEDVYENYEDIFDRSVETRNLSIGKLRPT